MQFVLNYEEGGENNILHGDAASEAFLVDVIGAAPWPGKRHWNVESMYEYGARAGFWRLHRLFTGIKLPVTVYGVATALQRAPEQTRAMLDAGWEIASHGLKWIDYRDHDIEHERRDLHDADNASTPKCIGDPPHRLVLRPHLGEHRRSRHARKAASPMSRTPTTTTCPITASTSARRS